ncbi:methyl-accepting chemotaxis protein [Donghicola mangrovi]|uniref:Methyl-accepting chemotaxis protein n=1 Tax=Donghicola mangrovi TaxID=2729614 RepID=A0A850Q517_9RHOB|nr:methyl-accepting chemotaxis protein [Donghicola mangrovi]NVO24044.1 hypothetical protein [Donghicola mangrovi]
MKFKYKLGIALFLAGLVPVAFVSKVNIDGFSDYAERQMLQQANTSVALKRSIVENYFHGIIHYGQVIANREDIGDQISNLAKHSRYLLKKDEEVTVSGALKERYDYQRKHTPDTDDAREAGWYDDLDPVALKMQQLFIADNPNKIGEKHLLDVPEAQSTYGRLHGTLHKGYRGQMQQYGFYDIFLIEPQEGRIVYSVFKEVDYGTRLVSGPYKDTNFGKAAQEIIKTKGKEPYVIADFAKYAPSFDAQAAFILFPVGKDDTFRGIFAVQMPSDIVAKIIEEVEKDDTRYHSFLIGADHRLRSEYSADLSIGQKLHDEVEQAIDSGERGHIVTTLPDGKDVLAVWKSLHIPGLDWKIVSELDRSQAMAESKAIITRTLKTVGMVMLVIMVAGAFMTNWLLGPIKALARLVSQEASVALQTLADKSKEARSASESMVDIAQETRTKVSDVSQRSDAVNADVTEVAASIEELSAALQTVSQSVEAASTLTAQSATKAGDAEQASVQLQQAAKQINGVVTLIDDIAKQTKLLSINAAIEAANAGVVGSGFKVLAGEIGKLAQRTSQSTQEISEQIELVLGAVDTSTEAMREISEMIAQVNQQSQTISVSAHQQKEATNAIAERMRRTSTNVEVSGNSLRTVHDASGRAATAATQLLAGVGDVDEASHAMEAAIGRLNERLEKI